MRLAGSADAPAAHLTKRSTKSLRTRVSSEYSDDTISAAAAALIASTAGAADLPSYEAYGTPPAPQGVNWSGFYIGSQLGWAWGNGDADFDNGAPSLNYDPNGFVIGGHAGYNYQWGSLVGGVEGDIEWADADGGSDSSGAGVTSAGSIEMNWDVENIPTVPRSSPR